jgi:arylformamidase
MKLQARIIDISVPIHTKMVTYPGDPKVVIRTKRGKRTYGSEIKFGSHTGTHMDAPRHVVWRHKGADEIPLSQCVGPCRVLDMTRVKDAVRVEHLRRHRIQRGERILVRTRNSARGFKKFYNDYVYLDGDAAVYLAKRGIKLFGIDALSVKQKGSSDVRPHTKLLEKGIVIFETLDLSRVKPGRYTFVGLPLKLQGLDGAPARVVLLG